MNPLESFSSSSPSSNEVGNVRSPGFLDRLAKSQIANRKLKMLRAAFFLFPFSLFLLAASAQSTNDSTATTNDSPATDFSAFQMISDRNIFNPDRYGRTPYHHYESHSVPTFSLAGTMSYRKGMFAFFNGTSDDYRKAIQEGGRIAGYTIGKVTFDSVQLQSSGKMIEMKVGAAMRRNGDEWELSAPGEWGDLNSTESTPGSEASNETSTNQPSQPSGGEQNDVLKRLMEQRQQQLK
jgi:hypothetical protein